jgi:hypothetical protein
VRDRKPVELAEQATTRRQNMDKVHAFLEFLENKIGAPYGSLSDAFTDDVDGIAQEVRGQLKVTRPLRVVSSSSMHVQFKCNV